jgi:F0F1-type ATP synthase membrane subunit c/vacuolar-type H+-ATPase subunit K
LISGLKIHKEERQERTMANWKNKSNKNSVGAGIAIGVGIGAALGVALGNLALGIGVGVAIGVAVGTTQKQKNGEDKPED